MPVALTKPRRTGGARAETRTATKNPTASHFSGKRFKSSLIHKQYEAQMTHDEGRLYNDRALSQQETISLDDGHTRITMDIRQESILSFVFIVDADLLVLHTFINNIKHR